MMIAFFKGMPAAVLNIRAYFHFSLTSILDDMSRATFALYKLPCRALMIS